MNWINNQLAVGDMEDLNDTEYIRRLNLKIYDARSIFVNHTHEDDVEMWDIDVDILAALIDEIRNDIENGEKVMIHCHAGIDRSPFVAAYYLHVTEDLSLNEAYEIVKSKRPQTKFHMEWVNMFESPVDVEIEVEMEDE